MDKIIVAGSGTDVGKTVASAIITTIMQGDYWKPVQCGIEKNSDVALMQTLLDPTKHQIHPSTYSLKAPRSPHHAARLEGITIDIETIVPPQTTKPLIIEPAGGILVPLTASILNLDLLERWPAQWIVVSSHYLGSINHTLLTLEVLKQKNISLAGIIFNGEPNPDSEAAILEISKVPFLARLLPEPNIDSTTIQKYAQQWKPCFSHLKH